MTIYSGIFNSVRGSNGQGDRKYNAWWFAKYFSTFIGNGVFPNPSTNLQVVANTNMNVTVKPGTGWIDGYFLYSDSDHILKLDIADGVLKRIDRIVMRLNHLTRQIDIVVKKGTFASSPTAPTLQRDTDYVELALADVLINNGSTQITQANITDQRLNKTVCGIVHGTVDQVDTTTIFNQYQAWFKEITGSVASEVDAWQDAQKQEFLTWFESIKDILEGDVAGNLASRIASLEQTVGTHLVDYVSHLANGGTTGGTSTSFTCNSSPNPVALIDKMGLVITVHVDSGPNPTLKWGSNAAKSIKKPNGSAAILKKNGLYTVRYNLVNDSFILQGEGGEYGNVGVGDVRKGKTFGTETGVQTGILDLDNAVATNIREGVSIAGVTGNLKSLPMPASGNLPVAVSMGLGYTNSTTFRAVQTLKVTVSGTYQVFFNLWVQAGGGGASADAKLQRNGIDVTQQYSRDSLHPIIIYNTLTLNAGDVLTVQLRSDTEWVWAYCTNLGLASNANGYAVLTVF
ncbi:hypothetical protein [Lysinibacillus xylanilyticus]|uniref:hypothetical protein n=1 Tax=Lysinibacillus xylanilyticus TaxID=582475 RepID=UPI0036DD1C02